MRNLILLIALMFFCSCNNEKKNIIVYYSHSGTTEQLAKEILKHVSADTISLHLKNDYPEDFHETINQCKGEIEKNIYPELINGKIDLEKYDTIYLGYPIWFGTYARPITSFIRANNMLQGHVIVPFATYGHGGLRNSIKDLQATCTGSQVVTNGIGVSSKRIDKVSTIVNEYFNNPQGICGGFTEEREPSTEEIDLLNNIVGENMKLRPLSVKTQVVAGTNYIFCCKDTNDIDIEVKIYQPLPNQGVPELLYIEK